MNNGVHYNASPFNPEQESTSLSYLEGSLLQEMLDLGDVVALDHNMPSRSVDHDLLLGQTQKLPQLIPQHLRLSIHLLHPRHGLVSSGLFQRVNGQVLAGSSGDKVRQIGRAKVLL